MSAIGSILTNSGALSALNSIAQTSQTTNQLQNELASGLSISSPSDNPAGYITAQGFTSQINGLTQATSNANQGVSLLQTAQSAIGQQIGVVQQLNSIAVQAANSTQTASESQSLQTLVGQLTGQVSTIANQTQFNNINLLDGSFQNEQFQVGANEGQTISFSIGSTMASQLGMYSTSNASTAANSVTTGSGVVIDPTSHSATQISLNGTAVSGVTATSSAAAIAKAINASTGTTGVQAQASATNTAKYTYTPGTVTSGTDALVLTSSASGTSAGEQGTGLTVTLSNNESLSTLVAAINSQAASTGTGGAGGKSGITASISGSGTNAQLVLTQADGKNIGFGATTTTTITGAAASNIQQAGVQLQSSNSFSVSGLGGQGTAASPTANKVGFSSLDDLNVTTTSGANQAINVIKFALQGLNNTDGTLGAQQQRFSATIANLTSTSTNATTALGVVQDANIPAVANQLTQAQIQAQSGVAALKSSTELQQTYLSLLP